MNNPNAWLVVGSDVVPDIPFDQYSFTLPGERATYQAIHEDDWVLVLDGNVKATAVGRVYRIRSTLEHTILYFDKYLAFDSPLSLSSSPVSLPSSRISRLQWADFIESLAKLSGTAIADVPRIDDRAYIRELLQLAVMDDLLGPANGPREEIVDMSVRDRYLVGKLAPRDSKKAGGIEGLDGPLANEEADEPEEAIQASDKKAPNRLSHEPGAEFNSTTGRVEAEEDNADEIDAASNQSLIPSSVGITFCVSGDVESVEVEALWGRYERLKEHGYTKPIKRKMTKSEIESYKKKKRP